MTEKKVCVHCNEEKELSEFSPAKGWHSWCKECVSEYQHNWHVEHKAQQAIMQRLWAQKNKEKLRLYNKKYRSEHPVKYHSSIAKKERDKKHYANHRKKIIGRMKNYYAENREAILERVKEYRAKHREEISEYHKEYYAINRDRIINYVRDWIKVRPEKHNQYARQHRARKRNAGGDGVTAEQWEQIQKDYCYLCVYCGQKKPLEMDHIVPLSKGGHHDTDNIVPACKSCNSSKSDSSLLMFLYQKLQSRSYQIAEV